MNDAAVDGKMKLSKLDLPLLAQLKFFGILAIQAGPTFCLMTNTSGTADGVEWSIKRPTLGYAVGAEVRLWKLAVSARYNGAFKESEVYGLTTGSLQDAKQLKHSSRYPKFRRRSVF